MEKVLLLVLAILMYKAADQRTGTGQVGRL